MAPGTEFARDFCAGIGPLQLDVVLVFILLTLNSHRIFKKTPRFPDYAIASLKIHVDKLIWSILYAFLCSYDVINEYWPIPSFNIFNYLFNGTNYIKKHKEFCMLEANMCHHGHKLRNKLWWNWKKIANGKKKSEF